MDRRKALLLLLMNFALAGMAKAQNLVPNPSFEDTTYCIGWPPPQVEAVAWHTANTATPDVWDCDLETPCGYHLMDPDDVGLQLAGYIYAYDGDRFIGAFQWYGPGSDNTREYLTARLIQPLMAGIQYRVSIFCAKPTGVTGAVDHIGAYFGPDSLYAPSSAALPFVPQARLRSAASPYLADTTWVELTDTILAAGNEQWITFGTFENANDVDGIWLGWGSYPPAVYYYLDMISVVALEHQFINAMDREEQRLSIQGTDLVWTGDQELEEVLLLDGAGRLVSSVSTTNKKHRYPLPIDLPSGCYVAVARSDKVRIATRFIR